MKQDDDENPGLKHWENANQGNYLQDTDKWWLIKALQFVGINK